MKLGTLQYSLSTEEGRVKINWAAMPDNVVMLDVLRDWICDLEGVYETKRQEVFNNGETK